MTQSLGCGSQVDELSLPASCRCLLLGLNGGGAAGKSDLAAPLPADHDDTTKHYPEHLGNHGKAPVLGTIDGRHVAGVPALSFPTARGKSTLLNIIAGGSN